MTFDKAEPVIEEVKDWLKDHKEKYEQKMYQPEDAEAVIDELVGELEEAV